MQAINPCQKSILDFVLVSNFSAKSVDKLNLNTVSNLITTFEQICYASI